VLLITALLASMSSGPGTMAQDATESAETPDVVIPGTGDADEPAADDPPAEEPGAVDPPAEEPEADATPEASPPEDEPDEPAADEPDTPAPTSGGIQVSVTDPGNPAVMAHGLAFLTGEQSVWQVREVEPDPVEDAASEVSNAAFVWQVQGTSVIRNDVTGKRALLDPGEAYFKAGGDAYTTFADSDDSLVWTFEVVAPSDVQEDAFYESPLIDDYQEGVFDQVIVRYVLEPGETATLPDHSGPALVMSADGDIDIESGGLGLLGTADGQLITEDATVTNNSQNPAVFVMTAFGAEVSDATSGAAPASPDPAEDDPAADPAAPADEGTDAATTEDPVTPEEPVATDPPAADPVDAPADGAQTSINITAQAELYVVVVADGVTVFDGPIPDGGQSGTIVGSTFEVYTSYGAGTLFSNACGEEFYMGFQEGEATYTLTATPESCDP
jgi:hypothetical protein